MVPGSSGSPRFCFALLQRFSAPHERWAPETMAKIFTVPFGAGSRSPPPILVSSSSSSSLSGEISFSPTPARASAADTSGNSHLPLTDNRAHYSAALFHNPLLRWPPCGRASTVRRSLVLVELFFLALVPVGWLVGLFRFLYTLTPSTRGATFLCFLQHTRTQPAAAALLH